jgi:uncharacterized protein (UPF0305 family)
LDVMYCKLYRSFSKINNFLRPHTKNTIITATMTELINAFFGQQHHQQQQQQSSGSSTTPSAASRLQQQQLYMQQYLQQDQDELDNIDSKAFKQMLYQMIMKYVIIHYQVLFTH